MDIVYALLTIGALLGLSFAWWFVFQVLLHAPTRPGSAWFYLEPLAMYFRARLGLSVDDFGETDSTEPPPNTHIRQAPAAPVPDNEMAAKMGGGRS
ncbi:MAG TPA: hypothetical protein VGK50_01960 [Coriobacteriia bacterium]